MDILLKYFSGSWEVNVLLLPYNDALNNFLS